MVTHLSLIFLSCAVTKARARVRAHTHTHIGVLPSSFPMNKLCTQEDRRCASWPNRVFPLPKLLLFMTFWFLFNLNYLQNIELANRVEKN